jgi:4-amino-4-deoxy-L-arabinose transferase-like glycosyltransferase
LRRSFGILAIILIGAAVLRVIGLGAGIPYAIGVDEPQLVNRAVIMMKTGDFNPHFFDYPTLYIYLQVVVGVARFLTGAMAGRWAGLNQFSAADCYLWARALTALFGTLTVALVYRAARGWGDGPALLAAALMAVMPLHVRESHYALTDVPLTFFVTLTLLLSQRAHEDGRARTFAYAGAAAGLAAAMKYPGALSLLMPLTAAALTPGAAGSRARAIGCALSGAALAFVIACPYVLLDLPDFLNGFGRLAGMYTPTGGPPAWLTYLKHLRNALSWPASLAAVAGLVVACVELTNSRTRVVAALSLVFVAAFYALLARQSGIVFGRYVLPLTPFVCLFVASAAARIWTALRRAAGPQSRRAAALVLAALLLVMPAATSAGFDRSLMKQSTQALVYAWLARHAAPTQLIVVEGADLVLAYGPFRSETIRELRQKTAQEYAAEGATYLVASSACYGPFLRDPGFNADAYVQYTRLFAATDEVADIEPSDDHPGPEYRILKVRP